MDSTYYNTVKQLENTGIDSEYIQAWVGGYLGNPEREEQRQTEPYRVGYKDGKEKNTDHSSKHRVP